MPTEIPKRILVIRLSSLGDVLLTTPLIRSIKIQHPETQIDFLIREEYKSVLQFNPNINILYALSRSEKMKFLTEILKKNNYDFVIDLQNNFRSRLIRNALGTKIFSFKKPVIEKYLLVRFKINLFKKLKTITELYAESVPQFKLDGKGLELFIPEDVQPQLNANGNYIGFTPGSKHFTKRWLEEYFIELGNDLVKDNFTPVIFGGRDDKEICKKISDGIDDSINLCNDNDIYQTSADMKICKVIVCNDSGLMHTAAASGVPVIAIFGSSVKEFGFTPYGVRNLILENNSLSCRPCSHIGRSNCPKKHFKCMKELTPQIVHDNTLKFLSEL